MGACGGCRTGVQRSSGCAKCCRAAAKCARTGRSRRDHAHHAPCAQGREPQSSPSCSRSPPTAWRATSGACCRPTIRACPCWRSAARRYEREGTAFSYQNCLMAEDQGEVHGMMHAYAASIRRAIRRRRRSRSIRCSGPTASSRRRARCTSPASPSGPASAAREWGRASSRRRASARAGCGLRELSLLCFAGNTGARRLYERAGFVVVDWRPVVPHAMIRHTGDVLLMQAPV